MDRNTEIYSPTCFGWTGNVSTMCSVWQMTHDLFADNEESLGMSGSGTLMAGALNDFDFNDGCGFAYSTTGGSTWAPRTFVPGFTQFTNDPGVPGTGSFEWPATRRLRGTRSLTPST